jgi:hypothetical protein
MRTGVSLLAPEKPPSHFPPSFLLYSGFSPTSPLRWDILLIILYNLPARKSSIEDKNSYRKNKVIFPFIKSKVKNPI